MVLPKGHDIKVNNLSLPLKWTPTGPLLFIEDKFLEPIEWIVNAAVIGELPQFSEAATRREDVVYGELYATPPMPDEDLSQARARWRKLTGSDPGEDVYVLGTGFTYHEVVLPRKTLLQLIQALEKKRAEFPEPPFPWLFRLDPYFFSPTEGEQELIDELEERAVAFSSMQEEEADEALVSATRTELLRDLEAAGIFSEVYSKHKQEWLERWGASKLLAYHRDILKFLTHFRSRVRPPVAKQMVPAPVLGASISAGAWKPQWL
jgi:hypothetical protein